MPTSPLLTTGHWDPAPGNATSVVKVTQAGQVRGWGWVETTAVSTVRAEFWVFAANYVKPAGAQAVTTTFTHDSSGFPGGVPTTRAAFFSQLTTVWGSVPGVTTCLAPVAEAMAALPSGNIEVGTYQTDAGTLEVRSGADVIVGYMYTQANFLEHVVSATAAVGPGLPLILKASQTQYTDVNAFFVAMTQYLGNHGPPQRYEKIPCTWYPGVHPPQ